jgi:hypothetical protein
VSWRSWRAPVCAVRECITEYLLRSQSNGRANRLTACTAREMP